jgi:prenyltransferase beta subunit
VDWLLSCLHPKGGFAVMPILRGNIIPDLLSTATALHGLSLTGVSFDNIKERCLDFLDSLWSSQGAFRGNWADEVLDCEYTFYGLLALGYLS